MSLQNKIQQDSVAALKAGDSKKVNALRFLLSLVDKKAFNLPVGQILTDMEVLAVLQKELKNKEEARAIFDKAGRGELVAESDWEIELVKAYLPSMLSREEVKTMVLEVVGSGEKVFGNVMRQVLVKCAGRVDGGMVSQVVKEVLGN